MEYRLVNPISVNSYGLVCSVEDVVEGSWVGLICAEWVAG